MSKKLLQLTNIRKEFPGVTALEQVDFSLQSGEVKALVGENGAGKSTLIKLLAGIHQPEEGRIEVAGEEQKIDNPAVAKELGFAFIHQDVNLVPHFNAIENIWLGFDYPKSKGRFSRSEMAAKVKELAGELNFTLDFNKPVARLSTANKWLVAILKAFMMEARLLVLDEPTAALTDSEVQELFTNLRKIKEKGIAIIYISHRLEEIFQIADTITILKNGKKVHDSQVEDIDKDRLIKLMTGKSDDNRFPAKNPLEEKSPPVLRTEKLSGSKFKEISFQLRQGEILGFYGLIGSGRSELMEAIFGLRPLEAGEIYIEEEKIIPRSPADMISRGLALIPEDRRQQGLIMNMNVKQNLSLPNLADLSLLKPLNHIKTKAEKELAEKIVANLAVKTPSLRQNVKFLSGGNQQKVVIGKWLEQENQVYIFDEPTEGIDVGARREIYALIKELTARAGVIVVSSDLPEVIGLCNRVVVMNQGRITGELTGNDITEENILHLSYEEVE